MMVMMMMRKRRMIAKTTQELTMKINKVAMINSNKILSWCMEVNFNPLKKSSPL